MKASLTNMQTSLNLTRGRKTGSSSKFITIHIIWLAKRVWNSPRSRTWVLVWRQWTRWDWTWWTHHGIRLHCSTPRRIQIWALRLTLARIHRSNLHWMVSSCFIRWWCYKALEFSCVIISCVVSPNEKRSYPIAHIHIPCTYALDWSLHSNWSTAL